MFGFPVEATTPHPEMLAELGDNLLGRFVSVGLPISEVSIEPVPAGVRCPMCEEPLWHLRTSGSHFGRIVGGDTATAFVDVMPADTRCLACKECDLFFYDKGSQDAE